MYFIKPISVILVLNIVTSLMCVFHPKSNACVKPECENCACEVVIDPKTSPLEMIFTWGELGIIPIQSLEGSDYVFTAFDYDEVNDELILAGNYEINQLICINKENKDVVRVELPDIPLDLIVKDGKAFVLCLNRMLIVHNKTIIADFEHNIPKVTYFDKMLDFDNMVRLLMADGSSYTLNGDSFAYSKALPAADNFEIWIQKTSKNSFEVKSLPAHDDLNSKANYSSQIGSITFFGGTAKKYYIILDVISGFNPVVVSRVVKCNDDRFVRTITDLPERKFSFIKNDTKLHNGTVYMASVCSEKLSIKVNEL